MPKRVLTLLVASALVGLTGNAQQANNTSSERISFLVSVVLSSTREPVLDLAQGDFTVLDQGAVWTIRSFKLIDTDSLSDNVDPNIIRSNSDSTKTTRYFYELTFDRMPANGSNEYHKVEIRVDRRNLIVRAPLGYSSN